VKKKKESLLSYDRLIAMLVRFNKVKSILSKNIRQISDFSVMRDGMSSHRYSVVILHNFVSYRSTFMLSLSIYDTIYLNPS
jgi:hypothetical protein